MISECGLRIAECYDTYRNIPQSAIRNPHSEIAKLLNYDIYIAR
jgi:hypothetical protein